MVLLHSCSLAMASGLQVLSLKLMITNSSNLYALRISTPPEANRWSYYPSLEPATDVGKMDACQHLLMILSDMPCEFQLRESFDMSSFFEWERGLVET